MTNINKFILRPYQEQFIDSTSRFPALIAGIGTGKTFSAIMRAVLLSNKYPGNLGLIVRKEFTDLRDSTMKDFEKYTGMKINSMKEVTFPNGSQIMFRHASEVAVLKNINLGWFYIEQAEEFDTDEQFTYLRDRLRRGGDVTYRCGFLIANANGHNWIYKNWINNVKPEYHCIQATTFENSVNLAPDFIEDLKRMETDAPSHYRQYVLNDHNEQDVGDVLFGTKIIEQSINNKLTGASNGKIIVGVDVARFGDDRTVFSGIQYLGSMNWKQIFKKSYQGSDLMQTAGRLMDLIYETRPFSIVIDDIGVGGGLVDRMIELSPKNVNIVRYMANGEIISNNKTRFIMKRDEDYFKLREMLERNNLQLLDDEDQTNDLNAIRFTYKSGKKTILSKKDLKKLGYRSPDTADALQMAVSDVLSVYSFYQTNHSNVYLDSYHEDNNAPDKQLQEVRGY
ncbi:MAG: phage terminase large subunit [Smithella sp.]|jgi:phage terminase large subunit-like protein